MRIDKRGWQRFVTLAIFGLIVGCGGGGGGGSSSACSALGAKVFNGETCNQEARSPVVALFVAITNGTDSRAVNICTGTFVTLTKILTSAHCFAGPRDQIVGYVVRIGGDQGEAIPVSKVNIHPLYSGKVGSPFDIALATLANVPNPPVGPVPLALSEPTLVGDSVTTFGYGTNNQGGDGVLKAANLTVEGIANGNLLATLSEAGASICPGDSGGPLVKNIRGVTSLVGVNSFGFDTEQCSQQGSALTGFVDIQFPTILEFISVNAPDAAAQ